MPEGPTPSIASSPRSSYRGSRAGCGFPSPWIHAQRPTIGEFFLGGSPTSPTTMIFSPCRRLPEEKRAGQGGVLPRRNTTRSNPSGGMSRSQTEPGLCSLICLLLMGGARSTVSGEEDATLARTASAIAQVTRRAKGKKSIVVGLGRRNRPKKKLAESPAVAREIHGEEKPHPARDPRIRKRSRNSMQNRWRWVPSA